jgi:hypothetical protein
LYEDTKVGDELGCFANVAELRKKRTRIRIIARHCILACSQGRPCASYSCCVDRYTRRFT